MHGVAVDSYRKQNSIYKVSKIGGNGINDPLNIHTWRLPLTRQFCLERFSIKYVLK